MRVSDWIALIALIISIISLYRTLFQQRKNLTIKINECSLFRQAKKFDIFFSFNNLSSLPISINKIVILHNNTILFEDHGITELLYTSKRNERYNSLLYSNGLPINLAPYTSDKDIIRFDIMELNEPKDYGDFERVIENKNGELKIKIYTTRGKSETTIKVEDVEIKNDPSEFYNKYANHKKVSNQNLN
ncbi:hypothetical protein [Tetragenococcus halophilus]|uniref:hypothetical protein n=1 Tax=Tetragenococcus halophilus TaxID=51669 RepID=UPI0010408A20|nr:hypothetical protein [Tetragenococcus halophilus]MCO8292537.1 hypothetical protein [Tetragenococcus halophilus]MDN6641256.1 hypothetical protein [Tetragenococcus sp.]